MIALDDLLIVLLQRHGHVNWLPFDLPISGEEWTFVPALGAAIENLKIEETDLLKRFDSAEAVTLPNSRSRAAVILTERVREVVDGQISFMNNRVKQLDMVLSHWVAAHNTEADLTSASAKPPPWLYGIKIHVIERCIMAAMAQRKRFTDSRHTTIGQLIDTITAHHMRGFTDHKLLDIPLPVKAETKSQPGGEQRQMSVANRGHGRCSLESGEFYNIGKQQLKCQDDSYWCAISHEYHLAKEMRMASIVSSALMELNARYIFGEPEDDDTGHLLDARNCLPMETSLAALIDQCRITIVAASLSRPDSPPRLFVKVLDPRLPETPGYLCNGLRYDELDGRQLQFKQPNDRPHLRYVYWAFCMALFWNQRHGSNGWAVDAKPFADRRLWSCSDKAWYRHTTFATVARKIGHIQDVYSFLGTNNLPTAVNGNEDCAEADEEVADDMLLVELGKKYSDKSGAHNDSDDEGQ